MKEYIVCMVNGVKFHTRDLDNRHEPKTVVYVLKGTIRMKCTTSMAMCAKFGNQSMCFAIKLFCSSVDGTILVPMVKGKR